MEQLELSFVWWFDDGLFFRNMFLMISVFSSFLKAVSNICKDAGEFSIFFIFVIVFPLKIFWFKWFENMINLIIFLKIGR